MEKIGIKTFCEEYSKRIDSLKEQYIKDNLKIIPYVPYVVKGSLADSLLKIIMVDEDGNVRVNSYVEYLLLTRIFIEQYTNLEVETEGFFEEYDALKKSGLFDLLFIWTDDKPPLIPYAEMEEFKFIINEKKKDIMTNKYEIHSFIKEQVERFGKLANVTLNPIVDAVSKLIEDVPEEDINKVIEFAKRTDFREDKGEESEK